MKYFLFVPMLLSIFFFSVSGNAQNEDFATKKTGQVVSESSSSPTPSKAPTPRDTGRNIPGLSSFPSNAPSSLPPWSATRDIVCSFSLEPDNTGKDRNILYDCDLPPNYKYCSHKIEMRSANPNVEPPSYPHKENGKITGVEVDIKLKYLGPKCSYHVSDEVGDIQLPCSGGARSWLDFKVHMMASVTNSCAPNQVPIVK